MLRLTLVLPLMALFQCDRDETVAAYGASDRSWVLQEIDGLPFEASALLQFPEEGKIAGNAPCNSYNGTLSAPYPWFEIKDLAATRAATGAGLRDDDPLTLGLHHDVLCASVAEALLHTARTGPAATHAQCLFAVVIAHKASSSFPVAPATAIRV